MVNVAFYSHSMLLLSEVAQEGRSKLLVTARDMTIPPMGVFGGSGSLREAVGELEMLVPGMPSVPQFSESRLPAAQILKPLTVEESLL